VVLLVDGQPTLRDPELVDLINEQRGRLAGGLAAVDHLPEEADDVLRALKSGSGGLKVPAAELPCDDFRYLLAPCARWRTRVIVYGRPLPEPTASTTPLAAGLDGTGVKTASPRAWSWAALMHRAFGIDVLACAHRGGRLRLIATLHEPAVIRKILAPVALGPSGKNPGPAPPESGAAAS
jgi:hypothetical protein